MSKVHSVPSRVCDVFEQGCMYCANKKPTIFNPENYPQKMHIAEMSYHSPQGSLYVRETTAEVEEQPGEGYNPPPVPTPPPPAEEAAEQQRASNFKGLKQSCSGITFIEEKEEQLEHCLYQQRVKKKLQERKLWKSLAKQIIQLKFQQQAMLAGPIWFQELSSVQAALLDKLPLILKKDVDEKSTAATTKFLSDVGIVPMVDEKVLQKIISECESDILYFLTEIQKELSILIAKIEGLPPDEITGYVMKKRKYTVSERILLSSIALIQMPLLLFKLHLILPPPAPEKSGKFNVLAPLPEPGKLPDPKAEWFQQEQGAPGSSVTVISAPKTTLTSKSDSIAMAGAKSSIAQETQQEQVPAPDTSKQIQDSPSTWTMTSITPIRERKSQYLGMEGQKTKEGQGPTGPQQSAQQQQLPILKDNTSEKEMKEDANFPSFQSFFQGVDKSDSNYFIMESFTQTNVSFHENTVMLRTSVKPECDHEKIEKIEEEVSELLPFLGKGKSDKVATKTEGIQTDLQWLPSNMGNEVIEYLGESYIQETKDKGTNTGMLTKSEPELEDIIATLVATIIRKPTENEIKRKEKIQECLQKDDIDGLYEVFGVVRPIPKIPSSTERKSSKKLKRSTDRSITKKSGEIGLKRSASDKEKSEKVEKSEKAEKPEEVNEVDTLIERLKEEVSKQPFKKQLKSALKILAAAGDTLADFPEITKHPILKRWYELRRGIKRKLADKDKAKLLDKSKKAWDCLISHIAEVRAPKIELTPEQLATYTWDKRQWLRKKSADISNKYHRDIRQALVDDARNLYSQMGTRHYDSQLNKNLRELFFTYLPAKENDYYVFKPWRPEEVKEKKE